MHVVVAFLQLSCKYLSCTSTNNTNVFLKVLLIMNYTLFRSVSHSVHSMQLFTALSKFWYFSKTNYLAIAFFLTFLKCLLCNSQNIFNKPLVLNLFGLYSHFLLCILFIALLNFEPS